METGYTWLTKVRFYANTLTVYFLTIGWLFYVLNPIDLLNPGAQARALQTPPEPPKVVANIITGKPVRIVIPKLAIDLIVHEGTFNAADQTWTLTGYDAQYASPSIPPNNSRGATIIYGHNNEHVFGYLNWRPLSPGDPVQVMTSNGLTFTYSYLGAEDVKPDNMTAFQYGGSPQLTIQTCSGDWNEWRRMFRFKLEKIEQNAS